MSGRSPDDSRHLVAAFHQGLGQAGFVEGKNVAVEYRWALGQYDRLPAMAADLVKRRVAVLVAVGGDPSGVCTENLNPDVVVMKSAKDWV
jgi:putative ABC transport system substrate-binding protein